MDKNKVGNACRTKNQIRNSKSRGSSMEYDTQESLQVLYPDIYRTSERGFCLQYDLRSDKHKVLVECKRLKGMSWNQAKKFLDKLEKIKYATDLHKYDVYLVFKSNQQPALVMTYDFGELRVMTFEDYFKTPFIKHTSTRVNKK